ncbi:MAG: hypothetical protein LBH35_09705 [Treponema sp.]|jgi:hypothetical protein|nr:hypothetical protein [Treponema sp.]
MNRIAVFLFCFFLCGAAVHGQNILMTQADWNFLSPDNAQSSRGPTWLSGSAGTNILLYRTLIQNDVLVGFGGIQAIGPFKIEKPPVADGEDETVEYEHREGSQFLFTVSDNIFVSLNTKAIGLRAGFSGGAGIYSGELVQLFLNLGFLAGIHILPESLISFTVDIKPGYTGTIAWDFNNADVIQAISPLQHGWTFPLALSLRLNLDKL